ncbi:hypothetical protein [Lacticaseibacillus zeae]|uniref:Uncharacterized protein n=1 Tax=Lacticaseibacillus zeae subsp. silagei TaxID=3068307 RepID=A0ABD7Z8Y3_LACZE|nr:MULTISPECIES: hypothetical protein [Lacticaseibacillus]MDE3316587.1 hypothetical protein [Lacticaseibacillus zeae]WLV83383.1 hypothetical protein LACZS2_002619 [Lacticaseibacillus sp. NCIMB 15475]WLV86132.1 hypothetical protein LACZS1_002568 [Lacticaseibacillus sp. NCIMB 15474]
MPTVETALPEEYRVETGAPRLFYFSMKNNLVTTIFDHDVVKAILGNQKDTSIS